MYKWYHKDYKTEQIWKFINNAGGLDKINAKINPLSDIIDNTILLKSIEDSWAMKSLNHGKLGVCSAKCGTGFDPFGEQYK